MGNLTQSTAQVQTDLDAVEDSNVGLTSVSDLSDTTVAAAKKSGFHSLGASSSNAPSTDRSVMISAVRDTAASGEIRYGQLVITESNGLWWNSDDGGSLGTWAEAVGTANTQTISGTKTFTGGVTFSAEDVSFSGQQLILDADGDTSITADTDDQIDIKIGGSDEVVMTGTAVYPATSDGNALGTATNMWSDLFLASGGVVNFDNGNMTITHSANTLTFGGSSTEITMSSSGLIVKAGNLLSYNNAIIGYSIGSGGSATQTTSRSNAVTVNAASGGITLVSAAGSTSWTSMTVNCNKASAKYTPIVVQQSGTDKYMIHVTAVASGSFEITYATTGGTTTEQPVFNFSIIAGNTS